MAKRCCKNMLTRIRSIMPRFLRKKHISQHDHLIQHTKVKSDQGEMFYPHHLAAGPGNTKDENVSHKHNTETCQTAPPIPPPRRRKPITLTEKPGPPIPPPRRRRGQQTVRPPESSSQNHTVTHQPNETVCFDSFKGSAFQKSDSPVLVCWSRAAGPPRPAFRPTLRPLSINQTTTTKYRATPALLQQMGLMAFLERTEGREQVMHTYTFTSTGRRYTILMQHATAAMTTRKCPIKPP